MGQSASDVVIWSADVERQVLLDAIIKGAGGLKYIKLDRVGLTKMGLEAIDWVQSRGFKVFADAKIVEIPSKVVELARLHLTYEPWMLNCMAGIVSNGDMSTAVENEKDERDALRRFADICRAAGTRPCAVTVLTSKEDEVVEKEFGGRTSIDQVLVYVEWLLEADFTDLVCSTEELLAIRSERRFDGLDINVPGIRLPGSSTDDQARVGTPVGAMRAGATRLVIGRDLTNGNLTENFGLIAANLEPFLATN